MSPPRGTLLAVASRVADVYRVGEVRAFALLRTMSGGEVDHIAGLRPGTLISPCVGAIEFRGITAARPGRAEPQK